MADPARLSPDFSRRGAQGFGHQRFPWGSLTRG